MKDSFGQAIQQDFEPNYTYNSSAAISIGVQDGYWDQTLGQKANQKGEEKFELPNVVFFGPLKQLVGGVKTLTSGSNLRDPPNRDPNNKDRGSKDRFGGENFFDQSGVTIDGKKVQLKSLGGKKATLVVNVASK